MAARHSGPLPGGVPLVEWVEQFVGIPFVDGGADFAGVDCWGLVRLVYRELRQIELPAYPVSAHDRSQVRKWMKAESEGPEWERHTFPKPLDVVLFWMDLNGEPSHCGVFVIHRWMIHCQDGHGVALHPFGRVFWQRRFMGFWRYVGA